jgi:hypothetical protein
MMRADSHARADNVRVLKSDLSFHFVCRNLAVTKVEYSMENFLRALDFKVLNLARLQHDHGVFLENVHIMGIDVNDRIVDLSSVPLTPNRYSFFLRTLPPTERAEKLEQQFLSYVSNELDCEVRQILREENNAGVLDLYQKELNRVENLFREAERLEGRPRI